MVVGSMRIVRATEASVTTTKWKPGGVKGSRNILLLNSFDVSTNHRWAVGPRNLERARKKPSFAHGGRSVALLFTKKYHEARTPTALVTPMEATETIPSILVWAGKVLYTDRIDVVRSIVYPRDRKSKKSEQLLFLICLLWTYKRTFSLVLVKILPLELVKILQRQRYSAMTDGKILYVVKILQRQRHSSMTDCKILCIVDTYCRSTFIKRSWIHHVETKRKLDTSRENKISKSSRLLQYSILSYCTLSYCTVISIDQRRSRAHLNWWHHFR